MFGFNKRRLEEDLERIRKSNLSPEKRAAEDAAEQADKEFIREALKGVRAKDVFAMTIAAFSVVLPYFGGVVAFMFLFWLFTQVLSWTAH